MIPGFETSVLLIGKAFALIGLGVYIIFALVVVKQVNLMVATIEIGLESLIKFIAWAHFVFAVFIFVTALITL